MGRIKKSIERQYWNIKKLGRGTVARELLAVEICKYMGFDYNTYLQQPSWFIDTILLKMKVDSEYADIQAKKMKRNTNGNK